MIRLEMTLAMVRVMALELWRDRAALVMTFLLPPLVFLIFSSVFAGATGEDIKPKLAMVDLARTETSGRVAGALLASSEIRAEALALVPLAATLDRYADLPAFRHLENYGDLHRANMNRAFVEFESQ